VCTQPNRRAKTALLPYFRNMLHDDNTDRVPFGTDASCNELLSYLEPNGNRSLVIIPLPTILHIWMYL
jgi:hypothetical protein